MKTESMNRGVVPEVPIFFLSPAISYLLGSTTSIETIYLNLPAYLANATFLSIPINNLDQIHWSFLLMDCTLHTVFHYSSFPPPHGNQTWARVMVVKVRFHWENLIYRDMEETPIRKKAAELVVSICAL